MTAPDVKLRALEAGDKDRLLVWRNLPEIARWMYNDHDITPDEHERWFWAALADERRKYWVIEMDGRPVGLANLYDLSPAQRKSGWAYYLADEAVRGKGVGAFVEFWVIDHVFRDLKLAKLWCEVLVENEAVWKLHESFGFQREALFREHVWRRGQPLDVVGLGLLAADWERARPASRQRLEQKGFAIGD